MHPKYGYYSTKETIFNKGGDFTTSPEISQMFGEMVGVWFMTALNNYQNQAQISAIEEPEEQEAEIEESRNFKKTSKYQKNKSKTQESVPKPNPDDIVPKQLKTINLVEIGPGTGIMMCDILRTLNQFTGNLKNVQVNLIEASENLRKVQ